MILPEGYEAHPAADLFPPMSEPELRALAGDIKANGLRQPITLDGVNERTGCAVVIDGRNRLAACALAGVRPEFKQFASYGDQEPVAWVSSQNLHRRHLTPSQRAFIAVEAAKQLEGEARKRMLEVQNNLAAKEMRGAASANLREQDGSEAASANLREQDGSEAASANLREQDGSEAASANLREQVEGKAIALAAQPLQVSPRTAESAKRIERLGAPELLAAAKAGSVSIGAASEVAALPHDEQRDLVAQGRKAVAAKARELREAKRAQRHDGARHADGDIERPVRPAEIVRFDKPASAREALLERFARCVRHIRDEAKRFDDLVVELGYLLEDLDGNTDSFMRTIEDEIAQRSSDLEEDDAEDDAEEDAADGDAAINDES